MKDRVMSWTIVISIFIFIYFFLYLYDKIWLLAFQCLAVAFIGEVGQLVQQCRQHEAVRVKLGPAMGIPHFQEDRPLVVVTSAAKAAGTFFDTLHRKPSTSCESEMSLQITCKRPTCSSAGSNSQSCLRRQPNSRMAGHASRRA